LIFSFNLKGFRIKCENDYREELVQQRGGFTQLVEISKKNVVDETKKKNEHL
jgi:hypothetical protein